MTTFAANLIAKGQSQGITQGITQGIAQGETKLAMLINRLLTLGRNDDVQRVTTDEMYRQKLYEEFNIK